MICCENIRMSLCYLFSDFSKFCDQGQTVLERWNPEGNVSVVDSASSVRRSGLTHKIRNGHGVDAEKHSGNFEQFKAYS